MCSKNKEARFFELARRQAENGQFPHKIGCVVIYKGRVISEGYNIKKTHPLQLKYDKERPDLEEGSPNIHSMHAEINALVKIKDMDIDWSKVEIYIYRITKRMPFGLAKPCPSCTAFIKDLGIKKIHYTSNENSYISEYWN